MWSDVGSGGQEVTDGDVRRETASLTSEVTSQLIEQETPTLTWWLAFGDSEREAFSLNWDDKARRTPLDVRPDAQRLAGDC